MQTSFLFFTLLPEETISHSVSKSIFGHTVDDEILLWSPSVPWHQACLIRPALGIFLVLHFKGEKTVSAKFINMLNLK